MALLNFFKGPKVPKGNHNIKLPIRQSWIESRFSLSLQDCNTALDGYSNKVVFAVANVLVTKLLEAPLLVSKVTDAKHANRYMTTKSLNPERLFISKQLGLEEQTEHPLVELLDAPNDYQSGIELRRAFWFNKVLSGTGVLWVERHGDLARGGIAGTPKAIHCLPTYMVKAVTTGDWKSPIKHFEFTVDGKTHVLSKNDVLMSTNWSPDSMFLGWSPFKSIGGVVAKNNLNDKAQEAAFINGGTGILFSSDTVTDGVGGVSDKMSPEQMEALKKVITEEYAGASNNKRMHFTNGFVTVQSFGDTLADLKLIEASESEIKGVCAGFGVSPILIGEGGSNTESNVVQAYKSLVTNNVVPKLREFDQKFNVWSKGWYKSAPVFVAHDITEYAELMPNMELVNKVYGSNPAVTLNEFRKLLGFDTKKDPLYEKSYIQSGFVPLEDAGYTNAYGGNGNPQTDYNG